MQKAPLPPKKKEKEKYSWRHVRGNNCLCETHRLVALLITGSTTHKKAEAELRNDSFPIECFGDFFFFSDELSGESIHRLTSSYQAGQQGGLSTSSFSFDEGWSREVASRPRVSDLYDQLPERHRKTTVTTSNTHTRTHNQRQ